MHFKALFLGMALAVGAQATSFTFTDPYAGQNNNATTNADVIGLLSKFDIESVTVSTAAGNAVNIAAKLNYNNGDTSLSSFLNSNGCCSLNIGDMLFSSGTNKWAVPLISHSGMTAAQLYSVTGFLTAKTVLGDPSGITYRPDAPVWGDGTGAVKKNAGTGTESVVALAGYEIMVSLSFVADSSFYNAVNSGQFVLDFAAATCGNDVIEGTATPEPVSMSLVGLGLLCLGVYRRIRRLA